MTWPIMRYLRQGELDNTSPGKVTGWIELAGMKKVTFELRGDFCRDIRGTRIRFSGNGSLGLSQRARRDMQRFAEHQTGRVGEITASKLASCSRLECPHIEIYSDQHGRMLIELEPEQLTVLGTLEPFLGAEPVRQRQQSIPDVAQRDGVTPTRLAAEEL